MVHIKGIDNCRVDALFRYRQDEANNVWVLGKVLEDVEGALYNLDFE